jgi:hypothetical protein
MSTLDNQFPVILPSDDKGYPDNRPNKYRVHLPRTLDFYGTWSVGLSSISYSHSWHNLGTLNAQWLDIHLVNDQKLRVSIPTSAYSTAENLQNGLIPSISVEMEKYFKIRNPPRSKREAKRVDPIEPDRAPEPEDNEELPEYKSPTVQPPPSKKKIRLLRTEEEQIAAATEPKAEALSQQRHKPLPTPEGRLEHLISHIRGSPLRQGDDFIRESIHLPYNITNDMVRSYIKGLKLVHLKDINKFKFNIEHDHISHVSLSPQLGYLLGFSDPDRVERGMTAKYSADLKGGIDAFGVYVKGLTENIICGGELVSLLRIVTVTGNPKFGDTILETYNPPMYLRCCPSKYQKLKLN